MKARVVHLSHIAVLPRVSMGDHTASVPLLSMKERGAISERGGRVDTTDCTRFHIIYRGEYVFKRTSTSLI